MSIFIIGGNAKTSSKLAQLLHASNHPIVIGSRSGTVAQPEGVPTVKFDWADEGTYGNAFETGAKIETVFIVFPPVYEVMKPWTTFIDLAKSKGVKRIVQVTGTASIPGAHDNAAVHTYLADSGMEYAILRPTWFIENFSTFFYHSIRNRDTVVSAAGDGRIPFVGAADIARAAYDAILAKKSLNTDVFVLGPKLYTYDEAVALLSEVLGRKITHKRLAKEDLTKLYMTFGIKEDFATYLADVEEAASRGESEHAFNSDKAILGKEELKDYFIANKQSWVV